MPQAFPYPYLAPALIPHNEMLPAMASLPLSSACAPATPVGTVAPQLASEPAECRLPEGRLNEIAAYVAALASAAPPEKLDVEGWPPGMLIGFAAATRAAREAAAGGCA